MKICRSMLWRMYVALIKDTMQQPFINLGRFPHSQLFPPTVSLTTPSLSSPLTHTGPRTQSRSRLGQQNLHHPHRWPSRGLWNRTCLSRKNQSIRPEDSNLHLDRLHPCHPWGTRRHLRIRRHPHANLPQCTRHYRRQAPPSSGRFHPRSTSHDSRPY